LQLKQLRYVLVEKVSSQMRAGFGVDELRAMTKLLRMRESSVVRFSVTVAPVVAADQAFDH
jgi:hypothetical protein